MSLKASVPANGFIVVPDTNVMRPSSDKPNLLVAQGFTDAINKLYKDGQIKLLVPAITKYELLAQKLRLASRLRDELFGKITTLQHLTGIECQLTSECEEDGLRVSLEEKFCLWAEQNNVTIIDAPVPTIDWGRLINDAIFRLPPFEPAPDSPKTENKEKGFKDALILETAVQIEADHGEAVVVLITKDELLKKAALKRLKSGLIFDCIDSFASHLAQLRDKSSESFALELSCAAKDAWDTAKESNLFDRLQIAEVFKREFSANLANPPRKVLDGVFEQSFSENQGDVRIPLGQEAVRISSPEYVRERSGRWEWKTDVEMLQLFQRRVLNHSSGLAPYVLGEDMRTAKFTVFWNSAKVQKPEIVDPKFDHLLYKRIWVQPASIEQVCGVFEVTRG